MVEAASERLLHDVRRTGEEGSNWRRVSGAIKLLRGLTWAVVLFFLAWNVLNETRTSYLQSRFFTWFDSGINYRIGPGSSPSIRFPQSGPRDTRLGYAELPSIILSLESRQFQIMRQAQWSARLDWFVTNGGYPIYNPKMQAGLRIFDRSGMQLFRAMYPRNVYSQFDEIPPIIANTLMFIEDRTLLDPQNTRRDPAVAWNRFILASVGRVAGLFNHHWRRGGASTLATQ